MTACGTTCIPKKRIRSTRFFTLDTCGRILTVGNSAVLGYGSTGPNPVDGFESIGWTNQIEAGDTETITGVSGQVCYDSQACSIDRGQELQFIECTENDSLMALFGFGVLTLVQAGPGIGEVDGFLRTAIECNRQLAVEVIFEIDGDCDDTGQPICVSRLYPWVDTFVNTTQTTVNGKNVIRNTYTAKAKKGTGRLFENFLGGTPTGELAYWAEWQTEVEDGGAFYHQHCIPCPDLPDPSCELRALVLV